MEKREITVRTAWDDEAQVWVAVADGDIGLATEADTLDTLEALAKKLPVLALDLLEDEISEEPEIELIKLDSIELLFA
jgi:translation initiation factor IF-2